MTMRIPASRFTILPEGCPVWRGDTFGYWHTSQPAQQGELGWMNLATTEPVDHDGLTVDLSTPAAIRAFAPALIAQLVAVGRVGIVAAVPDDLGQYHLCIVYGMNDGGLHIRGDRAVRGLDVVEPTPEACLLSGLKAALVAACVAVGGAS
jgi:hypothetical protein